MIDEQRIEGEIDAALDQMDQTEGMRRAYLRGVREALGWTIGELDEAPVTEED